MNSISFTLGKKPISFFESTLHLLRSITGISLISASLYQESIPSFFIRYLVGLVGALFLASPVNKHLTLKTKLEEILQRGGLFNLITQTLLVVASCVVTVNPTTRLAAFFCSLIYIARYFAPLDIALHMGQDFLEEVLYELKEVNYFERNLFTSMGQVILLVLFMTYLLAFFDKISSKLVKSIANYFTNLYN